MSMLPLAVVVGAVGFRTSGGGGCLTYLVYHKLRDRRALQYLTDEVYSVSCVIDSQELYKAFPTFIIQPVTLYQPLTRFTFIVLVSTICRRHYQPFAGGTTSFKRARFKRQRFKRGQMTWHGIY